MKKPNTHLPDDSGVLCLRICREKSPQLVPTCTFSNRNGNCSLFMSWQRDKHGLDPAHQLMDFYRHCRATGGEATAAWTCSHAHDCTSTHKTAELAALLPQAGESEMAAVVASAYPPGEGTASAGVTCLPAGEGHTLCLGHKR